MSITFLTYEEARRCTSTALMADAACGDWCSVWISEDPVTRQRYYRHGGRDDTGNVFADLVVVDAVDLTIGTADTHRRLVEWLKARHAGQIADWYVPG